MSGKSRGIRFISDRDTDFGLDIGIISQQLEISRQRVTQLQKNAIRKLWRSKRLRKRWNIIDDYLRSEGDHRTNKL